MATLDDPKAELAECDRIVNGTPTTEHHKPELVVVRNRQEELFWEIRRREIDAQRPVDA